VINSTKFLAVLALGTALAAPAFAQQVPPRRDVTTAAGAAAAAAAALQYRGSQQGHNSNTNPDFQLGGER
jgi:hypothetical protein